LKKILIYIQYPTVYESTKLILPLDPGVTEDGQVYAVCY
jgi:hypothetical protein